MMKLKQEDDAPEVIECRSGKHARLVEAPAYNRWNDAYFVTYENDGYRFALFWPEMRDYVTGPDSPLDAIKEVTQ